MNTRIYTALIVFAFSVTTSVAVFAQSIQVIGGQQSARDCYMAATIAAQFHSASREDIDTCTFALENTSLNLQDRVATLVNRGIIYVALEEYNKAVKDYDKAYKINPDVAEVHVCRGNMFFMTNRFIDAVVEYTTAIELDPSKQYIVFYNRGLAYEKLGEFDKARADYNSALQLMPGWSHAQDKLDRLLNRTGKG